MFRFLKKHFLIIISLIFITQITLNTQTLELQNNTITNHEKTNQKDATPKKDWNFMVYITSNNNLYQDSIRNIQQMMQIGSNNNINILVQQDTYGKNKISRFVVEKGNLNIIQTQSNLPESISGTPQNLYNFAEWSITNFPAKNHAIILWDHGSGIEDPTIWGKKCSKYPNEIFTINPITCLFELQRRSQKERGIAFNDVFKTYITNQELRDALSKITNKLLNGKKIDILGMDACHMAMLEVGAQIKEFADYMVGSEEVEPSTGWNYSYVLKPFINKTLTPEEFAIHIVKAYRDEYKYSYADHTQSAINLKNYNDLEFNINGASVFLTSLISGANKKSFLKMLKNIRNTKKLSTIFDNKNYIDLKHFYKSLLSEIQNIDSEKYNEFKLNMLEKILVNGIEIIEKTVIANTCGSNLPGAAGISFYYPRKKIHDSYLKTIFAQKNKWLNFLTQYINETKMKQKKPAQISVN